MTSPSLNLSKVGALCILDISPLGSSSPRENFSPEEPRKYKIVYTKNCISQIHKHYKNQNQKVKIHLYKYCTRGDATKIRNNMKLHAIKDEKNMYLCSLDDIMDFFLQHFEPDLY